MSNQKDSDDTLDFPVVPTLFVGLGGSGKEVLLRIRRRFFTKYRVPRLPMTRFLWLDTDAECVGISREPDVVDRRIEFEADEIVNLSVKPQTLTNLYNLTGKYEHIFEWYSEELRSLGDGILQFGAGQIRSAGRLAFWLAHQSILSKLETARSALSNPNDMENQLEAMGIDNFSVGGFGDVKINVVVVASLAGGTGSGGFIDTGFFVRQHIPNAAITGHFFLPGTFGKIIPEKKTETYANGYAALKELNYYIAPPIDVTSSTKDSRKYRDFRFKWTGEESDPQQAPYDQVFLVEGTNWKGAEIKPPGDIFEVAAESLYLDFDPSRFSQKKRSNLSNVWQFLHSFYLSYYPNKNNILHMIPFRRAYSTYGAAHLVFDRERLRNAGAYHMGANLCRYWLGSFAETSDKEDHFRKAARKILGEDTLVSELLATPSGVSKPDQLKKKVGEAFSPMRDQVAALTQAGSLEAKLPRLRDIGGLGGRIQKAAQKVYDELWDSLLNEKSGTLHKGPVEDNDGDDRILIRKNVSRVEGDKKELIDQKVYEFLTTPVEYGLPGARGFLKACINEVDKILINLDAKEAPIESLKISPPEPPKAEDVLVLERKYSDARRIPFFMWPYAGIAQGHYRSRLEGVLDGHLNTVASALNAYLDELASQIIGNLTSIYRSAVRDILGAQGTGAFYDELKSYVGRQQKIEKDAVAGKKTIKATGLQLKLQAYEDAIRKVEEGQRGYFSAFTATRDEGRNHYAEKSLDWGEDTDAYLRAAMDLDDRSRTVEIYRKASRMFLSECGLLPKDLDRKEKEELKVGERDAMQGLVERSMHPLADEWKEVEATLEEFCFKAFQRFLTNKNAVVEIRERGDEELDKQIKRMVSMSLPWTPVAPAGEDFKGGPSSQNQTRAWLGVPPMDESQESMRGQVIDLVGKHLANHDIDKTRLQIAETNEGSLTLYIEDPAVPIFYFGGLPDYAKEYNAQLEQGEVVQCSRHADRHWEKFPDILMPDSDEVWIARRDNLTTLIEAFVTAVVAFSARDGFHFKYKDMGRSMTQKISYSLDASVAKMEGNDRLTNALKEKIQKRYGELVNSKKAMLILLKCYQAYDMNVFPDPDREGKNIRAKVIQTLYYQTAKDLESKFCSEADKAGWEEYLEQQLNAIRVEEHVERSAYSDYGTKSPLFQLKRSVIGR